MNYYPITIAGCNRHLPICKVNDTLKIAAFVMFGDIELTIACARELLKRAPKYDYIITAESKGIPLAYEMTRQSGQNKYFLARKSAKLYMSNVLSVDVQSITTSAIQRLYIDGADAKMIAGQKILIVDDVVSTGESMSAVEKLVVECGGQIAGRMTVLAEGAAANREDVIYLEPLPLFDADGEPMK